MRCLTVCPSVNALRPAGSLVVLSIVACCATGALGQEAVSASVEPSLSAVTVREQALESETGQTGLYTRRKSRSATGLDLGLKDTPQTVSVVSRSQMDDFGLSSVNDALSVTSGVRVERVETDRTYYTARGFDVTNFQVDGVGLPMMYGNVYGSLDTVLYDRIDAVYGANGLSTGTGYPSATINFVRKRTLRDFAAQAGVKVGSWSRVRLEGDISTPLNADHSVRARVVAAQEQGDSYLQRYRPQRTVFYGIIEADLEDGTQLALGHSRQENQAKGVMWGSLPLLYADNTRTDYDVSTSSAANWSYWDNTVNNTFAEIGREFGGGWTGKATYTHTERASRGALYYLSGQPDRSTGLGLSSFSSLYSANSREDTLNLAAEGGYTLAGRRHDLSLGLAAGVAKHRDASYYTTVAASAPSVPLDAWDGSTTVPVFDAAPGGTADFTLTTYMAYVATRLHLGDRLHLVGGLRHSDYYQQGNSYGQGRDASYGRATPYAGLTYDLTPDLTFYGSYAEIFNPQYQVDVNLRTLKPVEGDNVEIGLKKELQGGKGNASFALFRSAQRNLAEEAGYIGTTTYYRGIDAISQGVHVDVTGQLSPRLQANLGYTALSIDDPLGKAVRTYIPRQMLRLSTTYRVPMLEQLKVGGNLTWQDDTYVIYNGTEIRQRAYALLNLMARYDISKKISATINLNNVTDQKYLNTLYWGSWGQGYYGAPRNVSVALNWTY